MRFETDGTYTPYKTDLRTLNIIKSKSDWKCRLCQNEIPKGSIVLGGSPSWWGCYKVCLNCADNYFKNAVESINIFLNLIKSKQKQLKENLKEYQKINAVANI